MTGAGVALLALASRDVFDALFHPEGRSTLARTIMRGAWRLLGRRGRGSRTFVLAGPLGLVLVFATWAALLIAGWTLVFLPHVPEGFQQATAGGADSELVEAVNISLVTLTTLGFGDVTPDEAWLRVVVPIEALLGFGLLRASVSGSCSSTRCSPGADRSPYEVSLFRREDVDTGLGLLDLEPDVVERPGRRRTSPRRA